MQMKLRGTRRVRPVLITGVVALGLLLSGCAKDAPQDTLKPEGPFARQIDNLFKPVFWVAVAVFVIVEGLIVFAVFRFRRRNDDEAPKQIHGNFRLELGLTAAPLLILAIIAVPTIGTLLDLSKKPSDNPLTVDVIGHQWWWEYRYPTLGITTATELHFPVNRPVYLRLHSVDVIHSFWIPRLNGKKDVIPGRLQTLKIEADQPGTYLGQCTEFCGASHAYMRNRGIAQTPDDFDAWVAAQKQAPDKPSTGTAAADGEGLFTAKGCAGCHTIQGVSQGLVGPNLTHLQSRTTFAGGIFSTNPRNLAIWLRNPPEEKPGSKMPNLKLSEDEIAKLVAYLETLK